jgi:hypothetical protein
MHGLNQTLNLEEPSLLLERHIVVVMGQDLAKQGEGLPALKKLTCCPYHLQVVLKKTTMAAHDWMGKR